MSVPSYKAVLRAYEAASAEVQDYFGELPHIVEKCSGEVSLAYMFIRLERGQVMIIYN